MTLDASLTSQRRVHAYQKGRAESPGSQGQERWFRTAQESSLVRSPTRLIPGNRF